VQRVISAPDDGAWGPVTESTLFGQASLPHPSSPAEVEAAVRAVARRLKIDPDFVVKVFTLESNLDPSAVSPTGAVGVAQLTMAAVRQFNESVRPPVPLTTGDRYNFDVNVLVGVWYLRWCAKAMGLPAAKIANMSSSDRALVYGAYNLGVGALHDLLKVEGGAAVTDRLERAFSAQAKTLIGGGYGSYLKRVEQLVA